MDERMIFFETARNVKVNVESNSAMYVAIRQWEWQRSIVRKVTLKSEKRKR